MHLFLKVPFCGLQKHNNNIIIIKRKLKKGTMRLLVQRETRKKGKPTFSGGSPTQRHTHTHKQKRTLDRLGHAVCHGPRKVRDVERHPGDLSRFCLPMAVLGLFASHWGVLEVYFSFQWELPTGSETPKISSGDIPNSMQCSF